MKLRTDRMRVLSIVILVFGLATVAAAKAPDWVKSPPVDSRYYSGVGSAAVIPGSTAHIENARQAALAAIAAQIQVNISAEVMSSIMESGDELAESFRRNIQSSTQAQLEGYEQVGQHSEGGTYYAYYRLSKAKYAEIQAEKRRKASELALSFYREYESSLAAGEPARALNNLIRALESMDAYIPEGLKSRIDGEDVFLSNVFTQKIQSLLDQVEIIADPKVLKVKAGEALKDGGFRVVLSGAAMKNVSLLLESNGSGNELGQAPVTDGSGRASLRTVRIRDAKKIQNIRAELLLQGEKKGGALLYPALLSALNKPAGTMVLQVSGPVIYMTVTETYGGKEPTVKRVEPALKDILTKAGFSFGEDLAAADFMMEVTADAREGSQVHTLFTSFADLNVSVTSMSSGNEIYKKGLNRVKGIDLDFEKAQLKALEAIGEKVQSEIAGELIKALK